MLTVNLSVVELFETAALGLKGRHAAVMAHMPSANGGDKGLQSHLVDVVPLKDDLTLEALQEAFDQASALMPYKRSESGHGWEIDYYMVDRHGAPYRSSVMHIPDKPLAGKGFPESMFDWLAWRSRIALWIEPRDRQLIDLQDLKPLLDRKGTKRFVAEDEPATRQAPAASLPLTQPALSV